MTPWLMSTFHRHKGVFSCGEFCARTICLTAVFQAGSKSWGSSEPSNGTMGRTRLGPGFGGKVPGGFVCLTGWWLNHPFEKYARQNGNLPQFSGWKLPKFWNHHLVDGLCACYFVSWALGKNIKKTWGYYEDSDWMVSLLLLICIACWQHCFYCHGTKFDHCPFLLPGVRMAA